MSRWTHEIVMASSEKDDFEFETRGEVEMKVCGIVKLLRVLLNHQKRAG